LLAFCKAQIPETFNKGNMTGNKELDKTRHFTVDIPSKLMAE
jgi:hypothetical protein